MRLKELRQRLNLTQGDVADILEVDRTTYSKYEREQYKINAAALIKLAKFYNVTLDYLCSITNVNALAGSVAAPDGVFANEVRELVNEFEKLNKRQRTIIIAKIYELNDKTDFAGELYPRVEKKA